MRDKIAWGNIAYDSSFALLEKGIYLNAPGNILISNSVSLKYLLGCLNSQIFNYEFKQTGVFLGHAFEWKKQYVEQMHVPTITPLNKLFAHNIETLVGEIVSAKKRDANANISAKENEIDKLIYKLYGINEEEIRVIE